MQQKEHLFYPISQPWVQNVLASIIIDVMLVVMEVPQFQNIPSKTCKKMMIWLGKRMLWCLKTQINSFRYS